jgi:hypothetical protein
MTMTSPSILRLRSATTMDTVSAELETAAGC